MYTTIVVLILIAVLLIGAMVRDVGNDHRNAEG